MLSPESNLRNRAQIDWARPGTVAHGILERVAYFLYVDNPAGSAKVNWELAKNKVHEWSSRTNIGREMVGHNGLFLPDELTAIIRNKAGRISYERGHFSPDPDDWYKAQDEIATAAYKENVWSIRIKAA
jgi:hypothetical protein